jgi:putative DNA primase/helicase
VQDFPRRAVFAGTTNRDTWQTDDTGGRRFWPVEAAQVNLEFLSDNRNQLFAEAVALYKAGRSWWDIDADLAAAEVEKRFEIDEWETLLKAWLQSRDTVDYAGCMDALGMKASQWDRAIQLRVASILRRMGYRSATVYLDGSTKRAWKRGKK